MPHILDWVLEDGTMKQPKPPLTNNPIPWVMTFVVFLITGLVTGLAFTWGASPTLAGPSID